MREDILKDYDVNEHGIIQTPGKFEAEMLYVPHFYDFTLDGSGEVLDWPDGAETYLVDVDDKDKKDWPELPADCVALHMEESGTGFVSCETLTESELAELRARHDADWESADHDEEENC